MACQARASLSFQSCGFIPLRQGAVIHWSSPFGSGLHPLPTMQAGSRSGLCNGITRNNTETDP